MLLSSEGVCRSLSHDIYSVRGSVARSHINSKDTRYRFVEHIDEVVLLKYLL